MTTTALEEVTIELTGEELPIHVICLVCYPVLIPFETYALCGARLAGIDRPYGCDIDCDTCREILFDPCPKCGI